jgi:hypothetical protein
MVLTRPSGKRVGGGLLETPVERLRRLVQALGLGLDALAVGKRHVDCICEPSEE